MGYMWLDKSCDAARAVPTRTPHARICIELVVVVKALRGLAGLVLCVGCDDNKDEANRQATRATERERENDALSNRTNERRFIQFRVLLCEECFLCRISRRSSFASSWLPILGDEKSTLHRYSLPVNDILVLCGGCHGADDLLEHRSSPEEECEKEQNNEHTSSASSARARREKRKKRENQFSVASTWDPATCALLSFLFSPSVRWKSFRFLSFFCSILQETRIVIVVVIIKENTPAAVAFQQER